ncbi:hypothetical protein GCM10027168_18820 [Streptomyces capparidis]
MFRRLFWLVAGVAVGAWGTTKVNRAARRMTPGGLAETAAVRASVAGGRLRLFAREVRVGMAERERELNQVLGRDGRGVYQIRPGAPERAALPGPSSGAAPGDPSHFSHHRNRKEGH